MTFSKASKTYLMRASINAWALPYPNTMEGLEKNLELARRAKFDGIELNFGDHGFPSIESTDDELREIARVREKIGLRFSGLCSSLFWSYPLTSAEKKVRDKITTIIERMISVCEILKIETLLIVPGVVTMPWWISQTIETPTNELPHTQDDSCSIPRSPRKAVSTFQDAWDRATNAIRDLLPIAKNKKIILSIENTASSGFLTGPLEMKRFIDQFDSKYVGAYFDTANIGHFQLPEDWIECLDRRIANVHVKEFARDRSIETSFQGLPLGAGEVKWPTVIDALDSVGYRGYLTFEKKYPYRYYSEALVFRTADYINRMLGREPLYD